MPPYTCSMFLTKFIFEFVFYTALSFCGFSTFSLIYDFLNKKLKNSLESYFLCIFSQIVKLEKNRRASGTYINHVYTNILKPINDIKLKIQNKKKRKKRHKDKK